ncbi:MAG: hypothetical protein NC335_07060 [Bacteroides sp.]|nr:hypothetical protein [Bacteroides sp.]
MDNMTQTLLVEGNDDCHLIYALRKKFNIAESFDVHDCKGVEKLLQSLPVWLKGSGETKTIGLVVDADANIQSRWKQIRKILEDSNLYADIPDDCPSKGLIINPVDQDNIKIGVWIMPDNNSNGMLEDFAAFLIPEGDGLLTEVDDVLAKIKAKGLNKYKQIHHSKARIHTWLAWQEDPGTPMGLAVTKKYLSTTPPVCQDFVDWLNALYN